MSAPNLGAFLSGALNPPERGRRRKVDLKALLEVELEDEALRPVDRPRVLPPVIPFVHDPDREHWAKNLPPVLTDDELRAIPTEYEVWILPPKGKAFLSSRHRVGPKSLFGLKWSERPNDYQREIADLESRLVAQRAGWDALLEGARRVDVRSYRRKEATSRFTPGPVVTNWVATMKSLSEEPWVLGEPSEKALKVDAEYDPPTRKES